MNGQAVSTAAVAQWNYDMSRCPKALKVLLLTKGGTAVIGHYYSGAFVAWSPLPKRDKAREERDDDGPIIWP